MSPASFANAPQPPTQRAQTIFCRVTIEGHSVEQVAKEHGIQPLRVRKIVQQVRRWMKHMPRGFSEPTELLSAETLRDLHLARLEHQWEQTMLAWHRSTQVEEVEKVIGGKDGIQKAEKTRRSQTGEVKYLTLAREIMEEIRALSAFQISTPNPEEPARVESLTLAERDAAVSRLLETLGERARAAETGGTAARSNAAA
jgi:hypothetical protein